MQESDYLFSIEGFKKTDIQHWGIKGQKWGVRRYQNLDGSLTPAGRKRYSNSDGSLNKKGQKKLDVTAYERDRTKRRQAEEQKTKTRTAAREQLHKQLKPDDVIEEGNYKRYLSDKTYRNKLNKDADLGLKVLQKSGMVDKEQLSSDILQETREWFLYEDQTIGMPTIARMINNGKSAKEVKNLIKLAQEADYSYDDENVSDSEYLFSFQVKEGNHNSNLEKFADECEKIKQK